MPGAAVSIKGIDKVQNKIRVLQGLLPTQVDAALMYGALAIEGAAKDICPVDTGRLRDSITTHAGTAGDVSNSIVVGGRSVEYSTNEGIHEVCVGTNVEYASYVEFGTGLRGEHGLGTTRSSLGGGRPWAGMSAQPYLRPALDEKGAEAVQRIAEKLKGELQR